MRIPIALLALVAMTGVAQADAGRDFIGKINGNWSGSGSIRTSANAAAGATTCRLRASGSGDRLLISGACDGAGQGANLSVNLSWVPATQEFVGTFTGANVSGSANLVGRLNGNTVQLAVTASDGTRSQMRFALSGNSARLTVTGGGVQYVSLPLQRG